MAVGAGRRKRACWRRGEVLIRVVQVRQVDWAVVRRVRRSRFRRMDSRSSGMVKTVSDGGREDMLVGVWLDLGLRVECCGVEWCRRHALFIICHWGT